MTEWFVSSAVLAALLIGAHYLLRGKISARLQYALWLVLLVRLLMPLSIGKTALSVANLLPEAEPATVIQAEPAAVPPAQSASTPEPAVTATAMRPFCTSAFSRAPWSCLAMPPTAATICLWCGPIRPPEAATATTPAAR